MKCLKLSCPERHFACERFNKNNPKFACWNPKMAKISKDQFKFARTYCKNRENGYGDCISPFHDCRKCEWNGEKQE